MFTTRHIAKGLAAAFTLTVISSGLVLAKPLWSPPPVEYLEYDLTPYFNSIMASELAFQYWRPSSGVESSVYRGLFDYAPGSVVRASPMVEAAPVPSLGVPFIGYNMTPYYNLAPGCPLNNRSDDFVPIC
jgi:hypothetical protein